MQQTSPGGFKARLRQLGRRQQWAFMAALCERLMPNYALYAQMTGQGDSAALRVVLDLVWEVLTVRDARIDFARQAEKLAELEPPGDDDSFGARRAVETVVALSTLLDALQGELPGAPLEVSRLSTSGVQAYVEMTEGAEEDDTEQAAARLNAHPLMDDERDFQEAALEAAEGELDREALKALRRLGRNDGVSNLGLSLES
ncbi:YjaG family protein [Modicisalibacter radicis]|uniref:YjaG family protein n=1 Tax=Halomonas sp. EAR18 TaxID=2518972 RepID=UPI00109C5C7A|nr:YjaG family protein [Halomonas sp. EAR18]